MSRFLLLLAISTLSCTSLFSSTPKEPQKMSTQASTTQNPTVLFKTTLGDFTVELYPEKAPISVKNFLQYVNEGQYDKTIFHRVIEGFMIQGGGFTANMQQKAVHDPITNEADNGLSNKRGTLAMARTGEINSATAQFFINTVDNPFLNFRSKDPSGYGYAVFGKVISGMDVIDLIKKVKTADKGPFQNVPVTPVEIITAKATTK